MFTIYGIKSSQAKPKCNIEKKRILHSKMRGCLMKIIQWINGIWHSLSVCYMCVSRGHHQSTKILRFRFYRSINLRFVPSLPSLCRQVSSLFLSNSRGTGVSGFLLYVCISICVPVACVCLIFNLLIWYLSSLYLNIA